MSNWITGESYNSIDYFVPYTKYTWEYGNTDYSIDSNLNFFLPAKEIIDDMNLSRDLGVFSEWKDDKQIVFMDPSVKESGESFALANKNKFCEWIEKNKLEIVWLVGGEKQMVGPNASPFFGRLVFNSVYRLANNQIQKEDEWFK